MPSIEWSEDWNVGVPLLDAQHRQIVSMLNEFRDAVYGGASEVDIAATLAELERYSQTHLEREELLLRVRNYPDYAAHKAEHDRYRARLASLQTKADRRDIAFRITNMLDEWWRDHILTSDQEYARFFRRPAEREAVKP